MKNKINSTFKITCFSLMLCSCTYIQEMFIGNAITDANAECSKYFSEASFEKACKLGVNKLSSYGRKFEDNEKAIKSAKDFCNLEYSGYKQEDKDGFTYEEACLQGIAYLQEIGEGYASLYNKSIDNRSRSTSPSNNEESSGEEIVSENKQVIEV